MIRRRITLQLTPLLDLLLVVIFAQYLQLQATAHQRVEEVNRSAADRIETAEKHRSDAEVTRSQVAEELRQKESLVAEARGEITALRERVRELENTSRELERQHKEDLKRLGEIASDLLHVDAGLFETSMQSLPPPEARRLKEELADMKGKPPEAVIRRLREMHEIRKRCDIWHVHVDETGRTLIRLPSLPAPAGIWVAGAGDLVLKTWPLIEESPEPKALVLILYSYADATWGARRPVELGLERLEDRLREEYGGRSFHVAPMGYTVMPPE